MSGSRLDVLLSGGEAVTWVSTPGPAVGGLVDFPSAQERVLAGVHHSLLCILIACTTSQFFAIALLCCENTYSYSIKFVILRY